MRELSNTQKRGLIGAGILALVAIVIAIAIVAFGNNTSEESARPYTVVCWNVSELPLNDPSSTLFPGQHVDFEFESWPTEADFESLIANYAWLSSDEIELTWLVSNEQWNEAEAQARTAEKVIDILLEDAPAWSARYDREVRIGTTPCMGGAVDNLVPQNVIDVATALCADDAYSIHWFCRGQFDGTMESATWVLHNVLFLEFGEVPYYDTDVDCPVTNDGGNDGQDGQDGQDGEGNGN